MLDKLIGSLIGWALVLVYYLTIGGPLMIYRWWERSFYEALHKSSSKCRETSGR